LDKGLVPHRFSQDSLVYLGKRQNGYTLDIATQHFSLLARLDHLTTLTVYKSCRPDLAWSSTAFTGANFQLTRTFWKQEAEASGFLLFDSFATRKEKGKAKNNRIRVFGTRS
jgi:hypothetical protein